MNLVLEITHETWVKTQPIDSQQLPANEKLKATVGEKFAPLGWKLAENQHVQFWVTDKMSLYAFIPHISLLEDGIDVLSPKQLVTIEQANYIFESNMASNDPLFLDLNACLIKFGIEDKEDIRQFLAQCAHESGGLRYLEELASGSDYEWRTDLGNTQAGDGCKYKGGGLIQLTGRANYQAFAVFMGDPEIINQGCSYVAAKYPVSSAGYFWYKNGITDAIAHGASIEDTTRIVNGGLTNLDDRVYYYNRAENIIQ